MRVKKEYLEKLEKQLSIDYNIREEQWKESKNIITHRRLLENRRQFKKVEPDFKITCYFDRVLVTAEEPFYDWALERYKDVFSGWVFQFMRLKEINAELAKENLEIRDIHHFFLPLESFPQAQPLYPVKWFEKEELEQFRGDNPFPEAICFIETCPDMLAVAAMDGDTIMGMAGVSADCEDLWQIGITVREEYRGKGIAANLVTLLKDEVIRRGKVPYYGTAESHNLSNGVAIKSGFFPVWSELISGKVGDEE